MPELPDVEVFRRYIDAACLRRSIDEITVVVDDLLEDASQAALRRRLRGARATETRRHGKHLAIRADKNPVFLLLHFGMTGALKAWTGDADEQPEYTALRIDFEDGRRLAYINKRKLGAIRLVDDFDKFTEDQSLGPDALHLERDKFEAIIENHRRSSIKSLLMNQEAIAGLGNVYTDEILFKARLSPKRRAAGLDKKQVRALHKAIDDVCEMAIEKDADPAQMPRSWILPRREEDDPDCPRCDAPLRREKVGGRGTLWCPACQR